MSEEHKIKLEIVVTPEFLGDILVTAFDGGLGGSWYWARSGGDQWPVKDSEGNWTSVTLRGYDTEGDHLPVLVDGTILEHDPVVVNLLTIVKGLQFVLDNDKISERFRKHVAQAVCEGDAGEIDADDADSLVQFGLFGKEIYG